ncbi:hypothetical protein F1D05_09585 [Kribbella qitaiheensis]|uniref:DNA-directed RNA polymerase n=1 Tax=Kribbella qitaiheensis TaxID=1544730 RepID=A0A7G6WVS6_9ACTN|nr:hypothetical protein [Kribbella qitaiheensis]QNE18091.1 hypothetical protein F1D05_09585 [Kribbella qitaiheensis]
MKTGHGLRRYFYEYAIYQAIQLAREATGRTISVWEARAIRQRIDDLLAEKDTSVADPELGVVEMLSALETSIQEAVPGCEQIFAEHTAADPLLQELQTQFMRETGLRATGKAVAALPISPYDPQWSQRATVKAAGTALVYLPDATIEQDCGGQTSRAAEPGQGDAVLWVADADGKMSEAGSAMTDEDASGLTALRESMSVAEYQHVRQWVLDGGRDPRTGRMDRSRFMSAAAVERSVAILHELQRQGLGYEVRRDQNPGQIKARVAGTGMEIRLTEPGSREEYAGARVYDNGMVVRYSTNHRLDKGRTAVYSPTPAEAVDLLRFAQGRAVTRQDRPELLAGQLGPTHVEAVRRGRSGDIEPAEVEDSYHVGKESMFVVKNYRAPGGHQREGSKVMLRREAGDRSLPEFFVNAEAAEQYLSQAVNTARANLRAALDAEGLVAAFEQQRAEGLNLMEFEPPEHSSDPEVAAVQRTYWDVLTGHRAELLRPGATAEMYEERLGMIGEFQTYGPGVEPDLGNLVYGGTAEEKVRAHADELLDELVGTWASETRLVDGELVEQRFDPVRVAKYMTSAKGQWSNLDELAQSLRRIDAKPGEMLGSGFQSDRFKDRLVQFDVTTAIPADAHGSAFLRRIGDSVRSSLARNATEPGEILIDHQGVIGWTAQKMRRDGSTTSVTGQIGQVFEPGAHGEILTRFAGGDNGLIVPGYEARIAPQMPGETKSVEERTLLRGYEQAMTERIEYQIAGDLLSGRSEVGEGASLNRVYSQLYGTKHPVDFIDRALDTDSGELDPWTSAILATEAKRVRYSNEIKAGSTVYAEHQAAKARADPADDNHFDAWKLTGGRNMAVLTGLDQNGVAAPAGYFDPVMTGGATNQGIVRYLTEDATVRPDGRIVPGDPATASGARSPLMNRPELETLRYDPFDRQQMTGSTLMQSSKITAATGTAMMTFGGWTADDPIVISREFARTHQIRGAGGELRDLVVGDKLSDLHGNKGVVSLVVDRAMPLDAADRQHLRREVAWFRANPALHVVMSPFSLISRRNAGSGRELISGGAMDLVSPDGEGRQGSLGQMRFIVTHMAVDEKTKVYDDGAVLSGKGRKASSQLAWALGAQDCPAIMEEFYGPNAAAEANLREYMLSVGITMDADGTLHVAKHNEGQHVLGQETSADGPERRLFAMPELIRTSNGGLHTLAMRRSFGALIGDKGGDLEIPFPLRYRTGEQTAAASKTSWKLPVLSSHLRSGQEFDDGSVITHDYTNRYLDIHEWACRYRSMQEKLDAGSLSRPKREELVNGMAEAAVRAQRSFEAITGDLEQRIFGGKHNIFKTGLMSSRLGDSATAVWTADPRLDIDQIALSPVMADQLGLSEGDHALVWRDPVLRDAGVRYLRVAVDQQLTGVAINPVMDQCFDGDFDGDAVAVVKLHSQAARAEAMAKLSVPANLLDTGTVSERGTHPFALQVSLDTQVALSKDPQLRRELDRLSGAANLIKHGAHSEDPQTTRARQDDVTRQLSNFYRSAQRDEFGTALSFADLQSHLNSVRDVCVTTGAKGNFQKLTDYARYLGGRSGRSGISQTDQEASMFATAIKAHGTGLGGSYSQRAVRALRNVDLKAVLEVNYPVTQSILQAKHDATEARHKYEMLQGAGRDLWRGRLLDHLGPGKWRTVFEDGEPVQATKEQWVEQFVDFYTAKDGFGVTVNPEYVDRVAHALCDPRTGLVRNLEDDPSLQGALMDRLAYGGTLDNLIAAAAKHENLFDGEKNEQFCSTATRRSRRLAAASNDPGLGTERRPQTVSAALVRSDVVPDNHDSAQARGGHRRSEHAVTVPTQQRPGRVLSPAYTPSIAIEQPTATDSTAYEMEG